jgi:hypothetical protein
MTKSLTQRCAASGHAAPAPPSSVTNSRRLTSGIGLPRFRAWQSVYRTLNLSQRGREVLGADRSSAVLRLIRLHTRRQEDAALRDFDAADDRFGSKAAGPTAAADRPMSALPPITTELTCHSGPSRCVTCRHAGVEH